MTSPAAEPSPASERSAEVAARLRVAVARLARILRQQDRSGLPATLHAALATVSRQGPMTLGELAAQEQVAPPTITKAVQKLEAQGLVARRTDETDGRISWVEITPEGEGQMEQARVRRTAWLATRLDELAPAELARLATAVDVLERLTDVGTERSHGEVRERAVGS